MGTQKSDKSKERNNDLVFSYLTLRNLIGFSGMLLPLLLVVTTKKGELDKMIEPSISDYYYTSNGDVFVVLLSVLGVFLFTYNGYNWVEKALTTLAAICGIGVSFYPTATSSASSSTIHLANKTVPDFFGIERHLVFAALFFIALSLMCLIYFPKTGKNEKTTGQKKKRNTIFYICGGIMAACVIALALYFKLKPDALKGIPVVFILETIAIEAFGLSWITKGQTLWPDGKHYLTEGYEKLVKSVM